MIKKNAVVKFIGEENDEKFSYVGIVTTATKSVVELFTEVGHIGVSPDEQFETATEHEAAKIAEQYKQFNAGTFVPAVAPAEKELKERSTTQRAPSSSAKKPRGWKLKAVKEILTRCHNEKSQDEIIDEVMEACDFNRGLATKYVVENTKKMMDAGEL